MKQLKYRELWFCPTIKKTSVKLLVNDSKQDYSCLDIDKKNYTIIYSKGQQREIVYSHVEGEFVLSGSSICRAIDEHMPHIPMSLKRFKQHLHMRQKGQAAFTYALSKTKRLWHKRSNLLCANGISAEIY